jgi:uncharacterized protein YaiI (UPF0178 family)
MIESRVIIDADACPRACLQIIRKLAMVYDFEVITVASFNHHFEYTHHQVTGNEAQATDIAIINQVREGDIVVTQDWGLAAMVLGKHALAIAPGGRIYKDDQMDLLLEERSMLAKFRRGGGRTRGPAKRTSEDDHRFEANFLNLLQTIIPGIKPANQGHGEDR